MTSKPPKNISPEDKALFRGEVADVRPLQPRHRLVSKPAPAPRARFRRQDEAAVLHESLTVSPERFELEIGEELGFRRPEISTRIFSDLRRGRYAVQDELDLHGLTAEPARAALRRFLASAVSRQLRCVRIIHGKGLRSGTRGPVLKQCVDRWLPQWDEVLAFASAPARDGGTGAVYVLLRRR